MEQSKRSRGRPRSKNPKSHVTSMRLTNETYEKLIYSSIERGIPISDVIEIGIESVYRRIKAEKGEYI